MCARRGSRFSPAAIGFSCGILPVGLCPDNPNGDEAVRTPHTLIVFVLECNYPNAEDRYNPYKTTENNGKTV